MGRPPTKAKELKDGWYIEVRNKGAKNGIKIRRNTEAEMNLCAKNYQRNKDVVILGESIGDKFVNDIKPKAKKKKK